MTTRTYGELLRVARIRAGMSQTELAQSLPESLPTTQSAISEYERGLRVPSHYQARCLEQALSMTPEEATEARELLVQADAALRTRSETEPA